MSATKSYCKSAASTQGNPTIWSENRSQLTRHYLPYVHYPLKRSMDNRRQIARQHQTMTFSSIHPTRVNIVKIGAIQFVSFLKNENGNTTAVVALVLGAAGPALLSLAHQMFG